MRSEIFFVTLVGIFAVALAAPEKECPLMKALKESMMACSDKLSEESAKIMEQDPDADNPEIHCFHACVMSHSGIMKDGAMDMSKLDQLLLGDPETEKEAKQIIEWIKECKEESETSDDECVVAGNYSKCLKAKKEH